MSSALFFQGVLSAFGFFSVCLSSLDCWVQVLARKVLALQESLFFMSFLFCLSFLLRWRSSAVWYLGRTLLRWRLSACLCSVLTLFLFLLQTLKCLYFHSVNGNGDILESKKNRYTLCLDTQQKQCI